MRRFHRAVVLLSSKTACRVLNVGHLGRVSSVKLGNLGCRASTGTLAPKASRIGASEDGRKRGIGHVIKFAIHKRRSAGFTMMRISV